MRSVNTLRIMAMPKGDVYKYVGNVLISEQSVFKASAEMEM